MEQTAVKWFAERISHGGLVSKNQFNELLKQANEIFEQQIKDAYQTSHISMMTAEQYYNETFKQKEQ
jgi:hypothetical protein